MNAWGDRRAVCRKCHVVMRDFEPASPNGEFHHPRDDKKGRPHWCPNAGLPFTQRDPEIEPYLRKGVRRRYTRLGIRP